MNEISTAARNAAGQHFKNGYNCAESIVRTGADLLGIQLDDQTLRTATGFGGGIGHAGCVCGALAASVMVIGLLKGRTSSEESRDDAYNLSGEFHQRFQEKFGGTCCRILNPHPFETRDHMVNCVKITGNTMALLADFLQEKGVQTLIIKN